MIKYLAGKGYDMADLVLFVDIFVSPERGRGRGRVCCERRGSGNISVPLHRRTSRAIVNEYRLHTSHHQMCDVVEKGARWVVLPACCM